MLATYDGDRSHHAVGANLGHANEAVVANPDVVVALNLKAAISSIHAALAEHRHAALDVHVGSGCSGASENRRHCRTKHWVGL